MSQVYRLILKPLAFGLCTAPTASEDRRVQLSSVFAPEAVPSHQEVDQHCQDQEHSLVLRIAFSESPEAPALQHMHFRTTTSARYKSHRGSDGMAIALLDHHTTGLHVSPHHLYEQTRASTTKYARFRRGPQAMKAPKISLYSTLSNHHAAALYLLIKALPSAGHGAHRSSSGKGRISKECQGFGVWEALWPKTERGRSSGSKKCVSYPSSMKANFNRSVFPTFDLCCMSFQPSICVVSFQPAISLSLLPSETLQLTNPTPPRPSSSVIL